MKIKSFNDVFAHFYKEVVTTYKIMIISEHSVLVFSHVFLNISPPYNQYNIWEMAFTLRKLSFTQFHYQKWGIVRAYFKISHK